MSAADGIRFTPWPHTHYPNWSLPALEAAKCVAEQSKELFTRLHLRLYEAFFTESRDIADRGEVARIVEEVGSDMPRFTADHAAGIGREAVQSDFESAIAEGVRSIPAVIVAATGRSLVGLAGPEQYRAAVEAAAG